MSTCPITMTYSETSVLYCNDDFILYIWSILLCLLTLPMHSNPQQLYEHFQRFQ